MAEAFAISSEFPSLRSAKTGGDFALGTQVFMRSHLNQRSRFFHLQRARILFAKLMFCIGAGSPIGVVEHGAASRCDHRLCVPGKAAIEGILTTNNTNLTNGTGPVEVDGRHAARIGSSWLPCGDASKRSPGRAGFLRIPVGASRSGDLPRIDRLRGRLLPGDGPGWVREVWLARMELRSRCRRPPRGTCARRWPCWWQSRTIAG